MGWKRWAAVAAIGVVGAAQAQGNTWPRHLPAANAWFLCSSAQGEAMVAWVDRNHAVVAVSNVRENWPLPEYAVPLLQDPQADRRLVQPAAKGHRVVSPAPHESSVWRLQAGGTALSCGFGRDE